MTDREASSAPGPAPRRLGSFDRVVLGILGVLVLVAIALVAIAAYAFSHLGEPPR